ncbi:unnamed protein product [Pleuronectes platessa]|uniref:Uncharacterized protein n=1 Tax=Pleuronectes platessa TaxID=8262 RepID=A0A9N7U7V2_PLEPL|nr:unnamed protein product [Pleuronectes platessa]
MSSGGETAAINNLHHMTAVAWGPARAQGRPQEMSPRAGRGDSHGRLIFNQVCGDDGLSSMRRQMGRSPPQISAGLPGHGYGLLLKAGGHQGLLVRRQSGSATPPRAGQSGTSLSNGAEMRPPTSQRPAVTLTNRKCGRQSIVKNFDLNL